MYCKTCGKENPEGTIECSTCGCNVNEGNMYCPKCGHFCLPGDTQCVNCGSDLSENISLKKTVENTVGAPETVVLTVTEPEPAPASAPQASAPQASAPQASTPQASTSQASTPQKYCRNCGLTIDASALRCPYCDSLENSASKYCPKCGMITTQQDTSCAYCGAVFQSAPNYEAANQSTAQTQNTSTTNSGPSYQQPQGQTIPPYVSSQPPRVTYQNTNNSGRIQQQGDRSFLVTLLLCVFLGYMGIHRFYTKNYIAGIIQLLTGGMCGIWWLIDLILIAVGTYRDGDGLPLTKDL